MNETAYSQYLRCLENGLREEAKAHLAIFISSFAGDEQRDVWAREYLTRGEFEHKIRHEIYEQIIFPMLKSGWENAEPFSLYWLARTEQNLCSCMKLWEQLNFASDYSLALQSYELAPTTASRMLLLNIIIDRLQFAAHEWPWAILSGMNAASVDDALAYVPEIDFARTLDHECRYTVFLDDFEAKVREFVARQR